jgi:hypothetical protein
MQSPVGLIGCTLPPPPPPLFINDKASTHHTERSKTKGKDMEVAILFVLADGGRGDSFNSSNKIVTFIPIFSCFWLYKQ